MSTRLPPSKCLACGDVHDSATSLGPRAQPHDGDVSICFTCGHIMIYENSKLRNPTDAEMHDIAGDPRIVLAQEARALAQSWKKH